MVRRLLSTACALGAWLAAMPAAALTLGQQDGFGDTTTQGWTTGVASPVQPVVQPDGGPAGAGDAFLLVGSSGQAGPGGRLVVFNQLQWAGDYPGAGVTGISMDLNNFGGTDLSLRLLLEGAAGPLALSAAPVLLPAGSGWTPVRFDLTAAGLTATAGLEAVTQLRLFHGSAAVFPGEAIAATLGLDNITAVPEPAAGWLWAGGLLAVAWRRRSRGR